jgi:hypothetical protein
MDDAKVDRLIARMWGGGPETVYAILDGARDPRVHPAVMGSGLAHQCLLAGNLGKELAEAAPYLVQLRRDAEFTRRILKLGWGNSFGIFLASPTSIEQLRVHFRRFLRVEDERGKRLHFRYYDPRVFRVYLPSCTVDELDVIFGPVTRYLIEAPDQEQMLVYRRQERELDLGLIDWAKEGEAA